MLEKLETSGDNGMVDPVKAITPQQLELIALVASGKKLNEIAEIKFMSWISVQKKLDEAKNRVGAKNLTHLCGICIDAGVIKPQGRYPHQRTYVPVQDQGVRG